MQYMQTIYILLCLNEYWNKLNVFSFCANLFGFNTFMMDEDKTTEVNLRLWNDQISYFQYCRTFWREHGGEIAKLSNSWVAQKMVTMTIIMLTTSICCRISSIIWKIKRWKKRWTKIFRSYRLSFRIAFDAYCTHITYFDYFISWFRRIWLLCNQKTPLPPRGTRDLHNWQLTLTNLNSIINRILREVKKSCSKDLLKESVWVVR